jgi:polyisoprenyl-phosphate glycosyltransferase
MLKVTVLVPAYNEEPRIGAVLETLVEARKNGIVDKIIVLNDGSTDQTAEVAKRFASVEVMSSRKNQGKGTTLTNGFKHALQDNPEFIMTLDADLRGLTTEKIKGLIDSIKKHDMSIGLSENTHNKKNLRGWLAIHTSGQRIFRTSALEEIINNSHFKQFMRKRRRFGFDMALSILFQKRDKTINTFNLRGLRHVSKKVKNGKMRGTLQNLRMNANWIESFFAAKKTATRMSRHRTK